LGGDPFDALAGIAHQLSHLGDRHIANVGGRGVRVSGVERKRWAIAVISASSSIAALRTLFGI
jgi:hypothetical protein